MREIKFKYICKRKNGHVFSTVFTIEDIENGSVATWIEANKIIDDLIRCRHTGLKDKNGKEIYEGDVFMNGDSKRIVEIRDGNTHCITIDGKQSILLSFIVGNDKNEVIGNIYEHPELL